MNSEHLIEKSYIETPDFDSIYKNLPETGTTTRAFAAFTADQESQKIFYPHFNRISLINCRRLSKEKSFTKEKYLPILTAIEDYSGPAALKLAQTGKKVVVLIFADATNVGGIYITNSNPAWTQEEQTILMAPEIYGYLGENFGVKRINNDNDSIYKANQKRYSLNIDDYENPNFINPSYGYILTNLLITHNVSHCKSMVKLPKDKIVEVSYAFFSMPSFNTGINKDPIGASLIGYSEEKDGELIYSNISNIISTLYEDKNIGQRALSESVSRTVGKITIFYPVNKLKEFANQYLKGEFSVVKTISIILKAKLLQDKYKEKKLKKELKFKNFLDFEKDRIRVIVDSHLNYVDWVYEKFSNLIKGAEMAEADTLVLGKIGCGAFLNDENEIAEIMGRALANCKRIKYVYFAGMVETDPFIENVRKAMTKN